MALVLLRASVSLRPSDERPVVAGGTGRVGSAIVRAALEELGGLDLVVHAAGSGFEPLAIEDVTEEQWDEALDVTAKGTFFLAQAAAPALRESKGVLVVVEDVASFQPWASFPAHS